jgi:hypothetical protein
MSNQTQNNRQHHLSKETKKEMTSILLLLLLPLLILCSGIAPFVEAFPSHRYRGKLLGRANPVRINIHLGQDIPVRTKSLRLRGNGVDFFAIASESSTVLSAAILAYPTLEPILRLFFSKLPTVQTKFPVLKNYVTRPALEYDILQVYNTSFDWQTTGAYTVIVGSKGAGKSYATAHVLDKKPGVLFLKVTQAETSLSFGSKLLKAGGQVLDENMKLGVDALYPLLEQIAQTDRPITIVFEVERGAGAPSDEVLYMVKSTAKELAHAANVIIILSEANAGLAFGDDRRQKFIWVDGMTHAEATMYAKKVFPAVADHDLETFFEKVSILKTAHPFKLLHDLCTGHTTYIPTCPLCANCRSLQVGTMPLDVGDFVKALKRGEAADDFIEAALCLADDDLCSFAHPQILEALKKSPDGVRRKHFRGVENKGVNLAQPKQVAVAMRETNAIVFHLPSGEYRMASRAHRTALLERYDPVE